jgi:hypothetical protein
MMEAARASETLVNFHQTTRRNIPVDGIIAIIIIIHNLLKINCDWNAGHYFNTAEFVSFSL